MQPSSSSSSSTVMANTVASDDLLEAMRKEDSSWHPCNVSFSLSTGLVVDFGDGYSEEVISTEEEALARLRIRSNPLQGDDCAHIEEGEHVLASPKTESKSLFFDAQVEKMYRVIHSKEIYCSCTFEIKWLCSKLKDGTLTVPSSSIMKRATNKPDSHPTVAAFLDSVRTLNGSGTSPNVSLVEDTVCEMDLPLMLEQQIEEIVRLADAPGKGCKEENMFELKRVNFVAQIHQRKTVTSKASALQNKALHENNNSKRSTRSQIKNNPPQPMPEESNRALLSPLGARAALASLVHELPQKPELSFCHVEQECLFDASQNTTEKCASAAIVEVTRTLDFDVCIEETVSLENDLPSTEKTHPCRVTLGQTEITVSHSPDRSASNKFSKAKGSHEMLILQEKPAQMLDDREDERLNIDGVKTHSITSSTDQRLKYPMKSSRLTRSSVQKGARDSTNDVELKSPTKDTKSRSSTHTTRLTRSALPKQEGKLVEKLKGGLEDERPNIDGVKTNSITANTDQQLNHPMKTTRSTRSSVQKGARNLSDDVELTSPTEDTKLSCSTHRTRLTRSALQKQEGKLVEKLKEGLEDERLNIDSVKRLKTNSITSTTDQGLNHPMKATRLTRSSVKKGARNTSNDVELKSPTEDTRLSSSTHTTRLTRSALQKQEGKLVEKLKEGLEDERLNIDSVKRLKTNSITSTPDQGLSHPMKATRLTRSSVQKGARNTSNDVELKSPTEDTRLSSSTHTTRLTRSALQKQEGKLVEKLNEGLEDERSNIHGVKTSSITSTADQELNHPMEATRLTRSSVQKGNRNTDNDVELKSPIEDTKLSSCNRTTRLTRSALQKQEGEFVDKSKEGLEEDKLAEHTRADSNKRVRVSVVAKETRMKKSCTSTVGAEINSCLPREKKQRVSDVSPMATRKGEVSANSEGRPCEKKTSSKKQPELRFSPRLRFLPRTRSQKKSPTC